MKRYFITGLVVLLPVTLTLIVVAFVFNLLTEPFLGISKAIVGNFNLHRGFLFFTEEHLQNFISQVLVLFVLIAFTIFLGFVTRWVFVHYMIRIWERILHRIPFISAIYRACQDVIKTIFTSQTSAFKQVVVVKFPNQETYALGLITREEFPGLEQSVGPDLVAVFVPTTPNPTSGFLTIFRKEDVIPLDMKVEDAFKFVISCGVVVPPFQTANLKSKEPT